jgi:hypothetical protein
MRSPLSLIGGLASSIIVSSPMLTKAFSLKDKGSESPAQKNWSRDAWRVASPLIGLPVPLRLSVADLFTEQ